MHRLLLGVVCVLRRRQDLATDRTSRIRRMFLRTLSNQLNMQENLLDQSGFVFDLWFDVEDVAGEGEGDGLEFDRVFGGGDEAAGAGATGSFG